MEYFVCFCELNSGEESRWFGERRKGKEKKTSLTIATVVGWSIIYEGTRNDGLMIIHSKTNTRQRRTTRENIPPLTRAIRRRRDRSVVFFNDSIGEIEQSSPRISNSINGDRLEIAITTNRVSLAGESPETPRAVDGDIGDGSRVFGVVDEAEIV